jgi:Uma2 family endonuclease
MVIEVLSPGDLAYEVDEKVDQYLEAGAKLIWVVSPQTTSIRVHRPKSAKLGPVSAFSAEDSISGEDIVPGFECKISEFFKF